MTKIKIAPSILSADFGMLRDQVARLEAGGADYIHVDVMDGVFVPNISIGIPIVEAVRKITTLPLDVHLMISRPENLTSGFIQAGADLVTIHAESTPNLHRALSAIRQSGKKAGLALNPGTPVSMVEELLGEVDLVLVMTVNPGFGGQSFIPFTLEKVKKIRDMIDRSPARPELEVDGGIKLDNVQLLGQAGADVIVSGSGIMAQADYGKVISELRARAQRARFPGNR